MSPINDQEVAFLITVLIAAGVAVMPLIVMWIFKRGKA
jgi:hypothetical protein